MFGGRYVLLIYSARNNNEAATYLQFLILLLVNRLNLQDTNLNVNRYL